MKTGKLPFLKVANEGKPTLSRQKCVRSPINKECYNPYTRKIHLQIVKREVKSYMPL